MTKKHRINLHKIYSILLSISIFVAGICLIYGCLTIYFTGEHSYSPEIVAETFKSISIPIYLCLALTLASFVWEYISPSVTGKSKGTKDYANIIKKLSEKKDFTCDDNSIVQLIFKERKRRKTHAAIRFCVILLACVCFFVYALNSNNFHQSEINKSMIKAMWVLIPCLIVAFTYSVFTAYFYIKSFEKELDLIKKLPALDSTDKVTESNVVSNNFLNIIRIFIVLIAIAVIIYGYFAGGTADVLTKAINICTECIGLG